MAPCRHLTCDRFEPTAKVLCDTHKYRQRFGKDMDAPIRRNAVSRSDSLWDRFYKLLGPTPPEEGCWVWPRCTRQNIGKRQVVGNYARMGVGGNRSDYVHRVSYMIHHGDIPEGGHVLHSCDNPPCVNPSHLRLGTPSDNQQESVEKGRHYSPWQRQETY